MGSYNLYGDAIDWLKFLIGSDIRIKIFLSLEEGAKDLSLLREETGAASSTILHAISSLEGKNLLVKGKDGYSLSHIGQVHALLLIDLIKGFKTLYKHKEFWLSHEILGIPEPLLKKLGDLSDSTVIRTTSTDLLKPFSSLLKLLSDAKSLKGVFPVFHQDFVEVGESLVDGGVTVWLIQTEEVFDIMLNSYREGLKRSIVKDNFKLWVLDEEVKEAFAVTDSEISLNLFLKNGVFDLTSRLVSQSDDAIRWGDEFFEYYRKKARLVKIDDV